MDDSAPAKPPPVKALPRDLADEREARRAVALRANLRRRKVASRAADDTPPGL